MWHSDDSVSHTASFTTHNGGGTRNQGTLSPYLILPAAARCQHLLQQTHGMHKRIIGERHTCGATRSVHHQTTTAHYPTPLVWWAPYPQGTRNQTKCGNRGHPATHRQTPKTHSLTAVAQWPHQIIGSSLVLNNTFKSVEPQQLRDFPDPSTHRNKQHSTTCLQRAHTHPSITVTTVNTHICSHHSSVNTTNAFLTDALPQHRHHGTGQNAACAQP